MEVRKSRFEHSTQEEKRIYLSRLRQRIKSGYMDSEKVMAAIAEKLVGTFDEEMSKF
jgi:hypothetical protein